MGIKKYIPNTITSLNLFCGVLGVIATSGGDFQTAFFLMLAAAFFDFCDGFAARLLGAYSDIGKELDSLADMVSFGVLPSLMIYFYMTRNVIMTFDGAGIVALLPLLIAVFSGLRLAKFNVDSRQSENFIGLATPACAMLCSSYICFVSLMPQTIFADVAKLWWCLPLLSLVLAALLVSEIPMFSMKIKKGAERSVKVLRLAFLLCVVVVAVGVMIYSRLDWSFSATLALIVAFVFKLYILINIINAIIVKCSKK